MVPFGNMGGPGGTMSGAPPDMSGKRVGTRPHAQGIKRGGMNAKMGVPSRYALAARSLAMRRAMHAGKQMPRGLPKMGGNPLMHGLTRPML